MAAFDPDAFLAKADSTTGFDPDAFLKKMTGDSTVPPSSDPVPSGQEGGDGAVPPVMGALPTRAPLPRQRPAEAPAPEPVAPEGELPTQVPLPQRRPDFGMELGDVPFRARMRGQVTDPETGEVREAPGLSSMYTGEEAYENRRASITAAQNEVVEAERRLEVAKERQRASQARPLTRRGTTEGLRASIDSEVATADKALDDARRALSAAEKASPTTEYPSRVYGAKAAETVANIVPTIVGSAARPIDEMLDKAGVKRGTGIADYMEEASQRISAQNISDPTQQDSWAAQLGSGTGSLAGFIAAGAVGKGLQAGAVTTSTIIGALQNAEQFYREAAAEDKRAQQFGGEPLPAWKKGLAYLIGGGLGATEGLGIGRAVGRTVGRGGGPIQYGTAVAKDIAEEGGQEWFQGTGTNVANELLYGKDPGEFGVFTGTAKPTTVGALLGGGVGSVVNAPSLLRGVEGKVPIPNTTPVAPEDIAKQIQEGGFTVAPPTSQGEPPGARPPGAPPVAPPPDVGGPTTPLPSGKPVTSVNNGVVTTTTLHGPADAYEVVTTPQGTPTLKPTIAPDAWYEMVNEEAESLYPSTDGSNLSLEAMAFQNGAHNHTWNVGLPPSVSAEQVLDAYNAGQQFGNTQLGEDRTEPITGMYSRVREWVAQKGPTRLPAREWMAKLTNNNAFRAEEIRDLQIPRFLLDKTGNVTKDELINYIDMMAAPMVETTRRPITPREAAEQKAIFEQQIRAIAAANPAVRTPTGINLEHPLITPLVTKILNIGKDVEWAQYEKYTTPGPREEYSENVIHTPARLSTFAAPQYTEPRGEVVYDPAGNSRVPWQVVFDGKEVWRTKTAVKAQAQLQRAKDDHFNSFQQNFEKMSAEFVGIHYPIPGKLVTFRATLRRTLNGELVALLEEIQVDEHQLAKKIGYGVPVPSRLNQGTGIIPDLPFKEGWSELGFSRFLTWAAQRGVTHIAWTPSAEQMRRYQGGTPQEVARRQKGMEHFYDKVVPSIAKRWARDLGGTVSSVMIPDHQYEVRAYGVGEGGLPVWGVFFPGEQQPIMTSSDQIYAMEYAQRNTQHSFFPSVILPQSAIDFIQQGLATHARDAVSGPEGATVSHKSSANPLTVEAITPLIKALNSLIKKMNLGVNVQIIVGQSGYSYDVPDPYNPGKTIKINKTTSLGSTVPRGFKNGILTDAEIYIAVDHHKTAAEVWATMVHELGHVIMFSVYRKASAGVRTAVTAAWEKYKKRVTAPGSTMAKLVQEQSNAVAVMGGFAQNDTTPIDKLGPYDYDYWTGFNEWFAEQVAKWATTQEKPLSHVEKFFSGIAKTMLELLKKANEMFGLKFEPVPELNAFLDSFMKAENIGPEVAIAVAQETTVKNAAQMGPEETAAPLQTETVGGGDGVNGIFDGRPPKEVQEAKAYADKFNWLYKWFTGIHQLAEKNKHIQPLQDYTETLALARLIRDAIMMRAQGVLKNWNRLGPKQADAVALLIDDIQNMNYRTPAEVAAGVSRHPTLAEVQQMATRYGVTPAGLAVFIEVNKTFQEFLTRVEGMLRADAEKIADATRKALQHARINRQMKELRSRPYFPAMRFGNYTVTIRNAAGQVIHFETFETRRQRDKASKALEKMKAPDDKIQDGYLDREVRPLLGVPTQLLELISEKLTLSQTQRDALDQLKFELSPAQSFKHRFQHKRRVQGYSTDFRRAYANYFFHGANYITRTMFADRLRALVKMTRDEVDLARNVTKREKIEKYMNHHLGNWLDSKSDWAAVRSIAFLWQLGFSPAAAMQNLSQTLLTSYPFLAMHFGDLKAVAALMKSGRDFETFYKQTTLAKGTTSFYQKAILQGIEDGAIKGTQAPELAGYADGNVLEGMFGGNDVRAYMMKFNEAAAFMFEMAEQISRRLVFGATLRLALENPNSKYVRETIKKRNLLYQKVRGSMTEAEAAAYVTAYDATQVTQFQYGKEYAARVLSGKKRAFFVFKTFYQSYFLFLCTYRPAAIRSLLILGFLAGFMGVPLADDLKQILRVLGWQIYGKDFKLDKEARRLILGLFGDSKEGRDWADLLLHGASRKGYGMPAVMDMLGGALGIDIPMPTFDRSKAMSMGTLLPIELDKFFGPPVTPADKVLAEQGQRAAGAVFGLGFAVYSAMRDQQLSWSDSKRWEKMMPRVIANGWKAYRAYNDKGVRTRTGSNIIEVDPRDPLGMAEIIGMGLGYNPTRLNRQWEMEMSKHDSYKFWEIRREGLMRQFGNAALARDQQEKGRALDAIRTYNRTLPPEAKGMHIDNDALRKSVETKGRTRAMQERGLPTKKGEIPLARAEEKLYPESQRQTRKVPRQLAP